MGNSSSSKSKNTHTCIHKPSQSTIDNTNLSLTQEPRVSEEINAANKFPDLSKLFLKENLIVWHDPSPKSSENEMYAHWLRNVCNLKIFKTWEEAAEFIRRTRIMCNVVTAGTNGELLTAKIEDSANVLSIYVLCASVDFHKTWAQKYKKIALVEKDFKNLLEHMSKKIYKWQRQNSSLRLDLPPVSGDIDKSEDNNHYAFLQSLTKVEDRMKSKAQFLALAKAIYEDQVNMDHFEKEYNEYKMETVLKWYTKECFLSKVIQNSLKIVTTESIKYCGIILRDLEAAIKEQYQEKSKNFNGLLYKGAYISDQDWTKLEQKTGKDIEVYGFLSTSKNKKFAIKCTKTNRETKALITIIVPPAPDHEGEGFAEVKEFSDFKKEDEVLFNFKSRFTVLEARKEQTEEGAERHLILLYGAKKMDRFVKVHKPITNLQINDMRQVRCSICESECSDKSQNSNIFFADLITKDRYICHKCIVNSKDKTISPLVCFRVPPEPTTARVRQEGKIINVEGMVTQYQENLNIPFYGYKCTECYRKKMTMCFKCQICQENKKILCDKCFFNNKDNECLNADHIIISERHPFTFWSEKMLESELHDSTNDLSQLFKEASSCWQARQYPKAKEYYQRFLFHNDMKNDEDVATAYYNLGFIYRSFGQFPKALDCYLKTLEIFKVVRGPNHCDTATAYNNLGIIHAKMNHFDKAMECHHNSLQIRRGIYGDYHPEVALSNNHIGEVYQSMGQLEKALEYHLNALEVRKTKLNGQHPDTSVSYHNLGEVYFDLKQYDKALECHQKALEVRKAAFGDRNLRTTVSYSNVGLAYEAQGELERALENHMKALELKRLLYGESHMDLAISYKNIGVVYEKLKEFEKATEYNEKSLEIQKALRRDRNCTV